MERLWRDIKEWVKRPGIRSKFLEQYLSRYLFIRSIDNSSELLHHFLVQAAKLYPPQSQRLRKEADLPLAEVEDEEDSDGEVVVECDQ